MSDMDRIKDGILAICRAAFPRAKYMASYPGKVIAQAADGTLDIRPDDEDMPEHQGVPIRYGVPGVTAKVQPGARCALRFAEGDPQKPFAELWESGTLIELKIGGGSDAMALANLVLARLNTIITAYNAHTHVVSVAGVQSGSSAASGAAAPVVAQIPAPASVASPIVKSD